MLSMDFSCDQLASTVSSVPAETLNVRSHFQSEICYAMPALQALMAFMGGTRSASIAFYRGYIASFPNQQSNHVNRFWLQVDNRV